MDALLSTSQLPYELPDFDQFDLDDLKAAIQEGIKVRRDEIDAIANNRAPADFDNTVAVLEMAGDLLHRCLNIFFVMASSDGDDAWQEYEVELSKELAALSMWELHHPGLFARLDDLYQKIDSLDLNESSRKLLTDLWKERKHAGVDLDEDTKAKVRQLKAEIAELEARFVTNVTKDRNDSAVHFDSADELDGLSADQIEICRQAAADRGQDGYLVDLVNFLDHPFQMSLTNRESREKIFRAQRAVGRRGNEWDNRQLCIDIAVKRAQYASLFGYQTFVDYNTAIDCTAHSAQEIEDLLYPLAPIARANADRRATELQQVADRWAEDHGVDKFELQAWDWSFFTQIAQQESLGIDQARVQNYLEYRNVLENGVFYAATQLYGVSFEEKHDLRAFRDDIAVFEVRDKDGSPLALFLHDPYTRPTKQGGAWMTNLVDQSHLMTRRPIVINCLNLPKPQEGKPTLLTLDELETMFHEFGHALHGIFSDVYYPSQQGTEVARDFVEYPSQINEMWMKDPQVWRHFAKHWATGEVLDDETIEALCRDDVSNQGYLTSEYLAATLIDQEWHKISADQLIADADEFENEVLAKVGLDNPKVPPRYSSPVFSHTFSGGYAGGYYSYIWAEILAAETEEWFRNNGGMTRANGDHFRAEILFRGSTRDEMESFRAFLGRDATVEPLLRKRGLLS